MSTFFLTSETIGHAIEKIEWKAWDHFQVGKTLTVESVGTLLTKEGERHRVQEWTAEVRKAKENSHCWIENIGKVLALALIVMAVATVVLFALGSLAATTVVGLSALGLLVIMIVLGGVANSKETEFEQQGLLRVQRLWNERNFEVALAKLPKITLQPDTEIERQLLYWEEELEDAVNGYITLDKVAEIFAALLLKVDDEPLPLLDDYISRSRLFVLSRPREFDEQLADQEDVGEA